MSRRLPLADLCTQLLREIANGEFEEANGTVQKLNALSSDPSVCNRRTLEILQNARTLTLIQRSQLQRRLRSLQASRLFIAPQEAGLTTWRIDA
jgi:hypothetical protein